MNEVTTQYETIDFAKAKSMDNKGTPAIVLRGCGHDDIRDGWIEGVNNELVDSEIFKSPMTEIYLLPTKYEERIDVVMVYTEAQEPNMGRMAMWRLKWQGEISWLEDYIVNDEEVHDEDE
jgi:hypothetical protein|tara:strand:+ start:1928 stop:2287 length:360 start_codon:yes stop_codon:yes gene_type:complete